MKIWAINVGEVLPIDSGTWRPWRVGVTTGLLAQRGHDVTWWSSTMNHHNKTNRYDQSTVLPLFDNSRLILLHGRHYGRNISWQRIANHRKIGQEFRRLSSSEDIPDVIFCSLPTLELAREAVLYGARNRVPVVVDIRDKWPDFMVELFPEFLHPIVRMGLFSMYRDLDTACSGATAITGNAPAFVNWGVQHSGRSAGPNDLYFPHGYPEISYPQELLEKAGVFWDSIGVDHNPQSPILCYVGSVRYTVMDFETVISAFSKLPGSPRLVICGDGDHLKKLKTRAAKIPNVIFSGWVDGPAIKVLMNRSVAGLAPYRNSDNFKDNLPNKYIEYMSASLPVISSLSGFSKTLLKEHECGVFFDEDDPASLLKTYSKLLMDRDQSQAMGAAGRQLYLRDFSAEKLYSRLADYLENVAAQKRI